MGRGPRPDSRPPVGWVSFCPIVPVLDPRSSTGLCSIQFCSLVSNAQLSGGPETSSTSPNTSFCPTFWVNQPKTLKAWTWEESKAFLRLVSKSRKTECIALIFMNFSNSSLQFPTKNTEIAFKVCNFLFAHHSPASLHWGEARWENARITDFWNLSNFFPPFYSPLPIFAHLPPTKKLIISYVLILISGRERFFWT